ncbi:C3 and PZP-like alpha-2-macroglobulin domain-containing protein 8 [Glandiceps talaboti]
MDLTILKFHTRVSFTLAVCLAVFIFRCTSTATPDPECANQMQFSTNTTYLYRYLASSSPITRVDFKAKAKNDVRIALSAGPQDKPALYEIGIGGSMNSKSFIRRSKGGQNCVFANTPSILSPNEFRGFWITYNNSVIKVGKEGHAAFMEWTDPNPLPVNNIGYSTGWGSNGEFEFCVDESTEDFVMNVMP